MQRKQLASLVAVLGLAGLLALSVQAQGEAKKVQIGKNITLEIEGEKRRVVIDSHVCLREGMLELLLTRTRSKEHEAILAAEVDARQIHAALLAAGAEPGKPVQFQPKFEPPKGQTIKVTLEYQDKEKTVRIPAQHWIREAETKKDLKADWVFTGSILIPNPEDPKKPPFFGANEGDIICIANFQTALLDVPFESTKDDASLAYEAHTERIPELKTPVRVILEPVKK